MSIRRRGPAGRVGGSWGGSTALPPDDLAGSGPGEPLVAAVTAALEGLPTRAAVPSAPDPQDAADLLALFEAQALSRWLDVAAARLHAAGIAPALPPSAGHEANAALGLALRRGDPALVHYRSGALVQARAARLAATAADPAVGERPATEPDPDGSGGAGAPAGRDPVVDAALGLRGAREHAGSSGRYPLAADPRLGIAVMGTGPAEHLPRALGMAWSIGRQAQLPRRHRTVLRWPDDAVVLATFGDGAVNRAPTLAALNAVSWAADQGAPLPLVLVCEDNGHTGGSPTASGWVRSVLDGRAGLEYLPADGSDPIGMLSAARWAVETVRLRREPVVLHVSCAPLGALTAVGGKAGPATPAQQPRRSGDAASSRSRPSRRETADPLVATATALVVRGVTDAAGVRDLWSAARGRVASALAEATRRPTPSTALEVTAPVLAHRAREVARAAAAVVAPEEERKRAFGGTLPEDEGRLTLAESINRTLTDAALARPGLVVLGPGVARHGGPHGVTAGLQRRVGASRVIDTLADEGSVVGLALGAGTSGLLPVAEPGPLGRFLGSEQQVRGQAAASSYYSAGAFGSATVLRVPGLTPSGSDAGWAGFTPDDLALGGLRDLPGVVVACLAHPSDAPAVLRTCLASAEDAGRTCVVIEPVALYDERDLVRPGDGGWASSYTPPARWGTEHAELGRASVWGEGDRLTIAAYGTGVRMALRVASRLTHEGFGVRVVDLRWLAPLPMDDVVREARATGRLLVVDELRRSAGVSAAIVTGALEAGYTGRIARVVAGESPVPATPAAELVVLSEASVEAAARMLLDDRR